MIKKVDFTNLTTIKEFCKTRVKGFLSQMQVLQIGYLSRFIMGLVGAFAFVGTLKLITVGPFPSEMQ